MFGGDRRRGTDYGRVANRKQRSELFGAEQFPFWDHGLSMHRFADPAWSILLKQSNKGRLSWAPLSFYRCDSMSPLGTFRTFTADVTMSVHGGRADLSYAVAMRLPTSENDRAWWSWSLFLIAADFALTVQLSCADGHRSFRPCIGHHGRSANWSQPVGHQHWISGRVSPAALREPG